MLGPIKTWDIDEVAIWLNCIGLSSKVDVFRANAVDGDLLVSLTMADLTGDLELSNLQAKKLLQRIETTRDMHELLKGKGGDGNNEDMAALESRLEEMELANKELSDQISDKEGLESKLEELKRTNRYLCDQLAEKEAKIMDLQERTSSIPKYAPSAPVAAPAPQPVPQYQPEPVRHQTPPRENHHHQSRQPGLIGGAARGAAGGAVKGAIGKAECFKLR